MLPAAPSRRPKILVTGFDPFGDDPINPSSMVAARLHGRQIAGHRVVAAQLPTVFAASAHRLLGLLQVHHPVLVVCLGLGGGRPAVSLERVAINIDDARIADNSSAQPVDTPEVAGGPAAYFSTLPIKTMLRAMRDAGLPAEVSNSAGTFVCNHVFYALMHHLATTRGPGAARGGFIHLPWLPGQARTRSAKSAVMELDDMVEAIALGLRAAIHTPDGSDIALVAGTNS